MLLRNPVMRIHLKNLFFNTTNLARESKILNSMIEKSVNNSLNTRVFEEKLVRNAKVHFSHDNLLSLIMKYCVNEENPKDICVDSFFETDEDLIEINKLIKLANSMISLNKYLYRMETRKNELENFYLNLKHLLRDNFFDSLKLNRLNIRKYLEPQSIFKKGEHYYGFDHHPSDVINYLIKHHLRDYPDSDRQSKENLCHDLNEDLSRIISRFQLHKRMTAIVGSDGNSDEDLIPLTKETKRELILEVRTLIMKTISFSKLMDQYSQYLYKDLYLNASLLEFLFEVDKSPFLKWLFLDNRIF